MIRMGGVLGLPGASDLLVGLKNGGFLAFVDAL